MALAENKLIKEIRTPNSTALGFEMKGKYIYIYKTDLSSLDTMQKEN